MTVGADERRHVDPAVWALTTRRRALPGSRWWSRSTAPRPRPARPVPPGRRALGGDPLTGTATIGAEARSWSYTPGAPWVPGTHHLVVDPSLEDLAGNSLTRGSSTATCRRPEDAPRPARPVALPFTIR